jgi:prepilin-type N-terminal cleavage/methylation domain-containing protein
MRTWSRFPRRGLTLIEVIVAAVIMGIIATALSTFVTGTREAGLRSQAIARAQSVNAAKQTYRVSQPNAADTYADAEDKDARYALIDDYITYAPATADEFLVIDGGTFTVQMGGSLSDAATLEDAAGNEIDYPKY